MPLSLKKCKLQYILIQQLYVTINLTHEEFLIHLEFPYFWVSMHVHVLVYEDVTL